jgi:uncharacterized protein YjiS (DUF1127 family)
MRENRFRWVKGSSGAEAPEAKLLLQPGGLSLLLAGVLWHAWWATGWALLARRPTALRAGIERSRQRRYLDELTDRELDDIGISRDAVKWEPRKPVSVD